MKLDLGDIVAEFNLLIKDKTQKPRSVLEWGVVSKTVPADRVPVIPQPYSPHTGKVTRIMNLKADQKVAILGMSDLDEMGNKIGPSAEQPTYTTSDVAGEFIVLTDNGDGTGVIAATGVLTGVDGAPVPQVTATFPDGSTQVDSINVGVGDMASRAFNYGEPEEVTPDA